jgi:antitoxin component YwqK of YwqJK toxin-antitoxin module
MYYKIFFLIVLSSMMMLSCTSDTELHKVMDEEGHLIEEYTRNVADSTKQGIYKKFYSNGGPVMEMKHFVNDTMNGEFVRFYDTGDTVTVAVMKGGLYHGYFREYYPGNKIMQSYQYEDNAIKGSFKEYYESGALKGELNFLDNKEDGPFIEYHENGNKSYEGTYVKGKEIGELLKYDENGELIRKMTCKIEVKGDQEVKICETVWKKEGIED